MGPWAASGTAPSRATPARVSRRTRKAAGDRVSGGSGCFTGVPLAGRVDLTLMIPAWGSRLHSQRSPSHPPDVLQGWSKVLVAVVVFGWGRRRRRDFGAGPQAEFAPITLPCLAPLTSFARCWERGTRRQELRRWY